jgi:hypothetical protein
VSPDLPKPAACPYCGKEQEASTAIDDPLAMPSPGDWSICFDCGGVSRYGVDLTFVEYRGDVPPAVARVAAQVRALRFGRPR